MKILLLEDHNLFATGLSKLLLDHFTNSSTDIFHSIHELKKNVSNYAAYDIFISDIEIPGENTLQLLEETAQQLPILVLSMHNKLPVILKCKKLGVKGYMLKDDNNIIPAVEILTDGDEYYSPKVKETLAILDTEPSIILSPREEEIMKLLADGKSNNEIANQLFVSQNTIATHRKNIYRKLHLSNTAEITKYYYDNYIS